jgi:hypothetical protein
LHYTPSHIQTLRGYGDGREGKVRYKRSIRAEEARSGFLLLFFLTFPILSLTIVVYATIAITHKQEAYDL